MWIAICDDDPIYCATVEKMLHSFLSPDDLITVYHSGLELLESGMYARNPLDLVLLDVEMPGLSGIETARELRNIHPSVTIIIISNYLKYLQKGYEIRAYNYLIKPLNAEKLKGEIEKVRRIADAVIKDVLHVFTKEASYFVPLQDIVYMESFERTLHVHTPSRKYVYYKQIKQAERELKYKGFFRIHKSYIVNLIYLRKVDKSNRQAIMKNGEALPIGPSHVNDLISAYISMTNRGSLL